MDILSFLVSRLPGAVKNSEWGTGMLHHWISGLTLMFMSIIRTNSFFHIWMYAIPTEPGPEEKVAP
jgi:hypothetical protein